MGAWLVLGLAGCGPSGASDAGKNEPGPAYLLLDPAMREEGGEVQIGTTGNQTGVLLPVDVPADTEVSLRTRAGRRPLSPEGGKVAWIHGPDAFVEWLTLGDDVTTDALIVEGDDAGVKELADMLAAQLEQRGDGSWELRADGLWERTAFLEAPGGVREARPVLRSIARAPVDADGPAPVFAGLPAVGASSGAALVGVNSNEHRALVLDAAGGFEVQRGDGIGNRPGCRLPAPPERGQYDHADGVLELRSAGGRLKYAVSGADLRGTNGSVLRALATEDAP